MPLSLLLVADTFIGYWVASSSAERAHDRALVEIARDVALHLRVERGRVVLDLPEEARRVLFSAAQGRIAFEVLAADGGRIAGEALPSPPSQRPGETLYDAVLDGIPVRVVQLAARSAPGAIVRVAETKEQRLALTREFLASVIVPQLLLIVIAGLVVWHGVVRGLAPLERLQRALATRSHVARGPVSAEGVPGEVRPPCRGRLYPRRPLRAVRDPPRLLSPVRPRLRLEHEGGLVEIGLGRDRDDVETG